MVYHQHIIVMKQELNRQKSNNLNDCIGLGKLLQSLEIRNQQRVTQSAMLILYICNTTAKNCWAKMDLKVSDSRVKDQSSKKLAPICEQQRNDRKVHLLEEKELLWAGTTHQNAPNERFL